jgi:TRAP-type mannitol/chloroaromatic compound transport system substrate-binding protein
MKRREFLTVTAAAGAAALAGCGQQNGAGQAPDGAPAVLRKKRTLKMVTSWPKNFPGLGMSAERVAQRITDITEGAITVKVYAAGELVGAFEAFDAVSSGTADLAHHADYYQQGKSKAFPFFTSVPFGLTAEELAAWIYFDGGQQLWDELYARFNAKPLLACATGAQMGGWYRREIKSLEDFKGLKVRMPGVGGEVIRRLGAAVVALPGGDIFTALQQGAIDGAEWVGPWNDLAFGFHKVAKHYYYPGFHEPGAALALAVNLSVWNDLTDSERKLFEDIASHECLYSLCEYKVRNAEAQQTLLKEHGISAKPFPDDVIRELGRVSGEVLEEIGRADDLTHRVYESFKTARAKYMTYAAISDEAFIMARRKVLGGEG